MNFDGIFTPVITPNLLNLEIDYKGLEVMLGYLLDSKVNGIVIAGTTGEYYAQSISERVNILKFAKQVIKKDLPFQLCSISIYVAAVALLKKNQTAFELIFYWGMVGASQAILTPDGDLFELKTFFVYSQAYHGILIFTVLWLVIKKGMRMEIKSIPKVVIITNLIVIFISIINYLMDSNYMFLRIRPNSISPFLVGEWPVYIIMVQFFSIVVVTLFIKTQDLLLKPLR